MARDINVDVRPWWKIANSTAEIQYRYDNGSDMRSDEQHLTPLSLSKSTILLPPTPSTHSGPWMCSSSDGCSALTSLVLYDTYTTTLLTMLSYYRFLSYELSLRSTQFTSVEHGYLNTRCRDKN